MEDLIRALLSQRLAALFRRADEEETIDTDWHPDPETVAWVAEHLVGQEAFLDALDLEEVD